MNGRNKTFEFYRKIYVKLWPSSFGEADLYDFC